MMKKMNVNIEEQNERISLLLELENYVYQQTWHHNIKNTHTHTHEHKKNE
jgi:hypothetical protein